MAVGGVARVDGVEGVGALRLRALTRTPPGDPARAAEEDGFVFAPGLLRRETVLGLRGVVEAYARTAGWIAPDAPEGEARAAAGAHVGSYEDPAWVRLQALLHPREEFRRVGDDPAIRDLLRTAVGEEPSLSTANTVRVFSSHPELTTPPHQDAHYVRTIGAFWTAWVPLGDCPVALGPLAVLPGSHRDGLRPHTPGGGWSGEECGPPRVWATADFRCGDVLLFHHHTLHRALPNRAGTHLRMSADYRYVV